MADFVNSLLPSPLCDGAAALASERGRSKLPEEELACHLFGESGRLERQERVLPVVMREPLFVKGNQMNLSRPDRYQLGLRRAKRLRQLVDELGWDEEDYGVARYLVDDMLPYDLHLSMFLTTLRQQASDEQQAQWLRPAEQCRIIGAYAQTELGHGSNVQGIETVAMWDPSTREFILHSPYVTASKWWIGGLGRTANHAAVVAQLLLPRLTGSPTTKPKYVSHGCHVFVVQIRDLQTHRPLKGIVIGDIGPKLGYASMDNGYMLFDHYRVPHSAMLSRLSRVNPETGDYEKAANNALVYGSLTYARTHIIRGTSLVLARAVTIAVRYTAIRRQFPDRDAIDPRSEPEVVVLDYPTVQIRVLPMLAAAFAVHYTGKAMHDLYSRATNDASNAALANVHGTSSGLKSYCTELTAGGLETCRRAMGGHGFSADSGFVQFENDFLSKPTVEGDNWMITQQASAYLIKKATNVLGASNEQIQDSLSRSLKSFLLNKTPLFEVNHDDHAIVAAFHHRTSFLTFQAHEQRVVKKRRWNTLLIQLHKLSNAYSQAMLVENFYSALHSGNALTPPLGDNLRKLFRLFSLYIMDQNALEFVTSSAVSFEQVSALPDTIQSLMAEIRVHAVTLVDAWKIPDYLLNSCLGRHDGKVYEHLFDRAHRQNPLNGVTFNPNYWDHEIVKAQEEEVCQERSGKL
ncbi:hypothetical protein AJ80_05491 [Polytolypa hystricis UAMH7299]|uniref:Acyl-coenzyme A oxidase n=1 Tax=Polytolypa hystricis (strain UAMH7299) TaxID=1447883 RepID=A0A2B7Y2B9_POLH7|nr:hypothetical protein AJ80_05491 [Polytolypa hystricis UAMH7299]